MKLNILSRQNCPLLAGGVTVLFSLLFVVSRRVVESRVSVVLVVEEFVQAVKSTAAAKSKKIVRMVKEFESGKVLLHQKKIKSKNALTANRSPLL
jgi:hypothetical protein